MTGVFCQSAIESSQNDHLTVAQSLNDNNEAHVNRLRTIFAELGACSRDGITFHAFEEKMHDPAVKEHLGLKMMLEESHRYIKKYIWAEVKTLSNKI